MTGGLVKGSTHLQTMNGIPDSEGSQAVLARPSGKGNAYGPIRMALKQLHFTETLRNTARATL
jgi:hypothetical protein